MVLRIAYTNQHEDGEEVGGKYSSVIGKVEAAGSTYLDDDNISSPWKLVLKTC